MKGDSSIASATRFARLRERQSGPLERALEQIEREKSKAWKVVARVDDSSVASAARFADLRQRQLDPKSMLTVDEARILLRVGRGKLYRLISQNQVPHRRIGKLIRFSRDAVLRWIEGEDVADTDSHQPAPSSIAAQDEDPATDAPNSTPTPVVGALNLDPKGCIVCNGPLDRWSAWRLGHSVRDEFAESESNARPFDIQELYDSYKVRPRRWGRGADFERVCWRCSTHQQTLKHGPRGPYGHLRADYRIPPNRGKTGPWCRCGQRSANVGKPDFDGYCLMHSPLRIERRRNGLCVCCGVNPLRSSGTRSCLECQAKRGKSWCGFAIPGLVEAAVPIAPDLEPMIERHLARMRAAHPGRRFTRVHALRSLLMEGACAAERNVT